MKDLSQQTANLIEFYTMQLQAAAILLEDIEPHVAEANRQIREAIQCERVTEPTICGFTHRLFEGSISKVDNLNECAHIKYLKAHNYTKLMSLVNLHLGPKSKIRFLGEDVINIEYDLERPSIYCYYDTV